MKTKRGQLQPAEMSLLMPLLAVLSTTVSLVAVMMFLSNEENSKRELLVPLRLLTADELTQLSDTVRSADILIQEDGLVAFDGRIHQSWLYKKMPELRAKIRAHFIKPDASKMVIFMEHEAQYERLMEVLNTFAACQCSQYQIVFVPALVGPPCFDM